MERVYILSPLFTDCILQMSSLEPQQGSKFMKNRAATQNTEEGEKEEEGEDYIAMETLPHETG